MPAPPTQAREAEQCPRCGYYMFRSGICTKCGHVQGFLVPQAQSVEPEANESNTTTSRDEATEAATIIAALAGEPGRELRSRFAATVLALEVHAPEGQIPAVLESSRTALADLEALLRQAVLALAGHPPLDREAGDEDIARAFHREYERLAPRFGYRTREASAKEWDDVPAENKALMMAVVRHLRESGILEARAALTAARSTPTGESK